MDIETVDSFWRRWRWAALV